MWFLVFGLVTVVSRCTYANICFCTKDNSSTAVFAKRIIADINGYVVNLQCFYGHYKEGDEWISAHDGTIVVHIRRIDVSTCGPNSIPSNGIIGRLQWTEENAMTAYSGRLIENVYRKRFVLDTEHSSEVCEDVDSDCKEYGYGYICVGDRIPWSRVHCKKYCGLCENHTSTTVNTSPTTVPVAAYSQSSPQHRSTATHATSTFEVCIDVDKDCYTHYHDKLCVGEMEPYAKIHCRKNCGFCKNPWCEDVDPDCDSYGRGYICTDHFKPWASIHCAKYCNFCDQGYTTTATMAATKTTHATIVKRTPSKKWSVNDDNKTLRVDIELGRKSLYLKLYHIH
ncbi:uncharacterized protein LOC127838949 isoform X2 [Dreissena polymorpha]|uniref:uncharacterized protein LOC127838949 isoform X2 n=1 Tax=Dreissena polymorpha TaxID=45954 RepID=UPI0022641C2C|nr:uncharacterized protein LOC127838949 isoform X2 [Dreissena polymorpha]